MFRSHRIGTFSFPPRKVTSLSAYTREWVRNVSTVAVTGVRNGLVSGLVKALDPALLDPSNAGVAGEKPASLTYGATSITPTSSLATDVGSLLAAVSDGQAQTPILFADYSRLIRVLAAVPGIDRLIPLVATPGAGTSIVAVDASAVLIADDGLRLDTADQAALQFDDTPSPGAQQVVSLWQNNLIAFLAERTINWSIRPGASAYLTLS